MLKTMVSLGICILAVLPLGLQGQPKSEAEKVRELEFKLMAAYKQRQVEVFGSLLDDDFVITFEDGSTYSKTGYLSYSATSSTRVDLVEMPEMKIHLHGETAVVTGVYHERGDNKGQPYDYHDRFTDVWMKKGGKWLIIASHYAVPYKQ